MLSPLRAAPSDRQHLLGLRWGSLAAPAHTTTLACCIVQHFVLRGVVGAPTGASVRHFHRLLAGKLHRCSFAGAGPDQAPDRWAKPVESCPLLAHSLSFRLLSALRAAPSDRQHLLGLRWGFPAAPAHHHARLLATSLNISCFAAWLVRQRVQAFPCACSPECYIAAFLPAQAPICLIVGPNPWRAGGREPADRARTLASLHSLHTGPRSILARDAVAHRGVSRGRPAVAQRERP